MSVVSSIDTFSTQSKLVPRGRLSSTRQVRSRMRCWKFARFAGATMGLTALRCTSCLGGSIAMNIGRTWPRGLLTSVMLGSEENTAWLVSTAMMSSWRVTDQGGP